MTSSRPAVHLLDVATTVPPHVCTRAQAQAVAQQVFAEEPEALSFLARLLDASGIAQRHTVLADYSCPAEARTFFGRAANFRPEPGTGQRNRLFVEAANELSLAAASRLVEGDTAWRSRVTHLVTASCTGFSAPGFDIHLVRALGLSPRVARTHVGFMGCYAGFSTLKLARALCQADPSALVLVVHVELCTLHVHFRPDPDTLVANSLFADGVAAALVGGHAHGPLGRQPLSLCGEASFLLPGGEEDMTWHIGDHGFDMTLSPRVPFLLHKHLPNAFAALLDERQVNRDEIAHWAIHPGGPAILEKACKALGLDERHVQVSRDVLAGHGNMSSATIFFLLDQIRRRREPGFVYACGFGPGLTLESALLHHPGAVS